MARTTSRTDANAEAPADQLLLDRQQRLDFGLAKFLADIRLRHGSLLTLSWPAAA